MDDANLKKLPWWTLLTAFVILAAFTALSYMMLDRAMSISQAEQFRWDRLLLIYNAVQSLGFAAAGVLLGTSIQAIRVAEAKADKVKAEVDAERSASDAEKARSARRLLNGFEAPGNGDTKATIEAVRSVLG